MASSRPASCHGFAPAPAALRERDGIVRRGTDGNYAVAAIGPRERLDLAKVENALKEAVLHAC